MSDVKPKALWPRSESPKTPVKTEEKIQDTEGMASKENPVFEDEHTPGEAASDSLSELEETTLTLMNLTTFRLRRGSFLKETFLLFAWIDELSAEQEHMMENGKPYRFLDIEDFSYMKQKIAERKKEAKEKKGMAENDKKENEKAKDEKDDSSLSEEPAPRQIRKVVIKNEAKPPPGPGNIFDDKERRSRTLE